MKTFLAIPTVAVLIVFASCRKQPMPVPDNGGQATVLHSTVREIGDTVADKRAIPPKKMPIPKK